MAVTSGYTIEQLIGLPALMGLMQETTTGLPDPIPDGFSKPKRQVIGNSARMFIGYGQRKTPRLTKYGAPSVQAGMEQLGVKDFILLSSTEVQPIDPLTFQRLHQFDNYDMQKMGAGEVARQVGMFKAKFDNLRIVQKCFALATGNFWGDVNGNVLPSSSGASADLTIDFGVAAGHKTQLNFDGGGNIIANLWSDATNANIPTQIERLQAAAAKETGLAVTEAFYTAEVPGYLRKNTFMQTFMQFDPGMYRTWNRSTTIPAGILGLNWHPVQNAFYEDSGGTNRTVFSANTVTFTPPPEKGGWWEVVEGSQLVPNTIDVTQRSAKDIMANAQLVYGQWAASRYQFDGGISLLNYLGDNFLHAIRNPKALWISTVA